MDFMIPFKARHGIQLAHKQYTACQNQYQLFQYLARVRPIHTQMFGATVC